MNQETQDTHENQVGDAGVETAVASLKLKRRILVCIIIVAAVMATAIFATKFIPSILNSASQSEDSDGASTSRPSPSIIFYTPDYDRTLDIRTDPSYLALNRAVRLKRGPHTIVITEDDLDTLGPAVKVLWNLINAMIDGDADAYNALFSERYYTEEGGKREDPFTMQRIYDIVIEEIREQPVDSKRDGK